MKQRLQKIIQIIELSQKQNVSLHRRMMFYLGAMLLAAAGMLLLILVGCGYILNTEEQIALLLQNRLDIVSDKLENDIECYEGYSLNLARQISRSIEYQMERGELSMDEYNDSPEKLLEIERTVYGDMNATLLVSGASGVFAVMDATVNTSLREASHSRSGLYLKANNIGQGVRVIPDPVLFRGSAEVAREKGLELHSRWNLEFDTGIFPKFSTMVEQPEELGQNMFWTERTQLKDTWEDALLLYTPIKGSFGKVYGICGLELNELYFRGEYPVQESECGTMITVIAPLKDGKLHIENGMLGNTEGSWLKGTDVLSVRGGKNYYTFSAENGEFYGVIKELNIPAGEDEKWAAAVLISKDSGLAYIRRNKWVSMVAVVVFIALMVFLVVHMSRLFVNPILQGLDDIKGIYSGEDPMTCNIVELEELKSFLISRKQDQKLEKLPENIEEMLKDFQSRVNILTPTERIVLGYYAEDYTLEEIADKMFISIGTAKKHNTNLNKKLEILSRGQLMVYIELFKRCGRLEDIVQDKAS